MSDSITKLKEDLVKAIEKEEALEVCLDMVGDELNDRMTDEPLTSEELKRLKYQERKAGRDFRLAVVNRLGIEELIRNTENQEGVQP